MSVSIGTFAFPNCSKYVAELEMDSGGSRGVAKIWVRIHGVTSSWDWYVNNKGWCYARLYIDDDEVKVWDVATWGANGSGLNGVQYSQWQSVNVNVSKTSTIRLTIDCRLGPSITGYGPLGWLDTGNKSPNWASVVSFIVAPTITSIYNNNKYKNQAGISASMNSVSVGINTGGDAPTDWQYKDPKDDKWKTMPSNPFTITGLSAGRSYYVNTYVANEAGNAYKDITIRTRYDKPTLEIQIKETNITDHMTIIWETKNNRSCQQIKYTLRKDNDWSDPIYINLYENETKGEFVIDGLEEGGHEYEVRVAVLSTSTYDSLWSDEYSVGAKSVQLSFLITPLQFEFGEPLSGYRNNPSGFANVIEYYIASSMTKFLTVNITERGVENEGDILFSHAISDQVNNISIVKSISDRNKLAFTKENHGVEVYVINEQKKYIYRWNFNTNNGSWHELESYTFINSDLDSIWDLLYTSLEGTSNILPLKVKIGTIVVNANSTETIFKGQNDNVDYYDATLILTGKKKTMRVYSNNYMDRIQAWVEEQNMMTEAVTWIGGPDSKPHRSI